MKKIDYGVILAAGEGTRMRPLTNYYPKVVLPVLNSPLVVHHLEIMKMMGINNIVFVVSEVNQKWIMNAVKKSGISVECYYIIQPYLGGTGHALLLARKFLEGHRFLLLLGDEYYNDTKSFLDMKERRSDELIMGVIEYDEIDQIRRGCNVHIIDDYVYKLIEKPIDNEIIGRWCWDGSLVLDSTIFSALDQLVSIAVKNKKDAICLVGAMQILLGEDKRIAVIKKDCKNINMTSEFDFIVANMLEFKKKYGIKMLEQIIYNI